MADEVIVVTLTAEAGQKWDEQKKTGAIGNHSSGIGKRSRLHLVFMPDGVAPGQTVRIRLREIKLDRGGNMMYRGEPAPVEYTERWKDNGDGTASRVTISTNWLLGELEEGVLETRALATRDGTPSIRSDFQVVWGQDMASSTIEDRQIQTIPLEKERVEGGNLVWGKISEREETLPIQAHPLKKVEPNWEGDWPKTAFDVRYNPDWKIVAYTFPGMVKTTFGAMPRWWQVEQEARYAVCVCGRRRRDVQVDDGYGKCELCRAEEHCVRCNKQTNVTLIGGNLVCDACKPLEEMEQLIARMLTADHKSAIAAEARRLLAGEVFAKAEAMVILGAILDHLTATWIRDDLLRKWAGYDWFYFCNEGIYGSRLTLAGLQILEFLPQAIGNGLVELVAWITTGGTHFVKTQIEGQNQAPQVTEYELQQLVAKLQASQPVLANWLRGSEQDRVAALSAKARLVAVESAGYSPELRDAVQEAKNLLYGEAQDYRFYLRKLLEAESLAAEIKRQQEAELAAQAAVERGERERLAPILEVAGDDIQSARSAQRFAEAVTEILGARQAIEVLREELDAPYGRARRQEAIRIKVSGIEGTEIGSRFLSFSRARDVNSWLAGAIAWLETSQEKIAEPTVVQPAPMPTAGGSFTDVGNRWFKCPSGHTMRVDKADWAQYQQGEAISLSCSLCGTKGEMKK